MSTHFPAKKKQKSRGTLELHSPPVPAPKFTPDGAGRNSLDGIQDPPSDVSDDDKGWESSNDGPSSESKSESESESGSESESELKA
ncbi:hypothetical protein FRC08_005581 [Ceratobasidium sp. 394]|nr:hypothetical protein FRC08_005581 [Ceratobasidium sp. 394]KAG9086993.1 hypothetical protein FS749_003238 [Ceratobasidium sp. UAMH 11750]